MPEIASSYNSAFTNQLPTKGFALGLSVFSLCHIMNISYSFRIVGLGLPILYDVIINKYLSSLGHSAEFKSIQFMDWLIQMRTAKCIHYNTQANINPTLINNYEKACGKLAVASAIT
jgi:hypothetical protein